MNTLRNCSIALAFMTLALYACGPAENNGGAPWGGFCNRTADCAPGLVCKGNICSIDTTDGDEDLYIDFDYDQAVDADEDTDSAHNTETPTETPLEYPFDGDDIFFWVTTNPFTPDATGTLTFTPFEAPEPTVTMEFVLTSPYFKYGPLDPQNGTYVFSIPGYRDKSITRDAIISTLERNKDRTMDVTLHSMAARPQDDSTTTYIRWNDYVITTSTGAFDIPILWVTHNQKPIFEAWGTLIGEGGDGRMYWARYRSNTAAYDLMAFDTEMNVHTIKHELLCNPLYTNTSRSEQALMFMGGCHWRNPDGDGVYSRYEYQSGAITELGDMHRDINKAIHESPVGTVVQGPSSFLIDNGIEIIQREEWLRKFEGFAHDHTVILSSRYMDPGNYPEYIRYYMKACPIDNSGICGYLNWLRQDVPRWSEYYALEYTSYGDGKVIGVITLIDEDDVYPPQKELSLYPLSASAQFGAPFVIPWDEFDTNEVMFNDTGDRMILYHVFYGDYRSTIRIFDMPEMHLIHEITDVLKPNKGLTPVSGNDWHQNMVLSDSNTLLYLAHNDACQISASSSGNPMVCGDLVEFDLDSGEKRLIQSGVRSYKPLENNGLLLGRACNSLDDACAFPGESLEKEPILIEHLPSLSEPEIRGEAYYMTESRFRYNGIRFSNCAAYRDPFTSGTGDQVLLHIDYRPGKPLFTAVSSTMILSRIKMSSGSAYNMMVFFTKSNGSYRYTREGYRLDNPTEILSFGCTPWRGVTYDTKDFIITADEESFSVIPFARPTMEYVFEGHFRSYDREKQTLVYGHYPAYELDLKALYEILAPQPTCY